MRQNMANILKEIAGLIEELTDELVDPVCKEDDDAWIE